VEAIKKRFNTFVALKGFPPLDHSTIDLMYASGFDIIDFPLGGFSGTIKSKRAMTAKQVHSALEYAAGIFPLGTVWTDLVLRPESHPHSKEGIDRLADLGVIPLIFLQRDSTENPDGYRELVELAEHMDKAIQRNRLPLKWLYPTCRFLSPLDTRFFYARSAPGPACGDSGVSVRSWEKSLGGFCGTSAQIAYQKCQRLF